MKYDVLWIEDEAFSALGKYRAPLELDGRFHTIFALNATDAVKIIYDPKSKFDAVIVDIIIPPGDSREWIDIYNDVSAEEERTHLGCHLLYSLFDPENARVKLKNIPEWVKPEKFGVASILIEEYIKDLCRRFNIQLYGNKSPNAPKTLVLNMVREILHIQ